MSAARSITLPSEVIMQPKPTVVTLSPVFPRMRYSRAGAADGGVGRSRRRVGGASSGCGGGQSQPGGGEKTAARSGSIHGRLLFDMTRC